MELFSTKSHHSNRCDPLQLLEGVGVISSSDSKKATYQESVTAPLSREYDYDDLPECDIEEEESPVERLENLNGVLSAIQKVRY